MITKKQLQARQRNWLILRLKGAKSIFSLDNVKLMKDYLEEGSILPWECHDKIDDLIEALRKSK